MTHRRPSRRFRRAATIVSTVLLFAALAAWASSYMWSLSAGLEVGFGPKRASRSSFRVGAFAGGLSASYCFIDHVPWCPKHSAKRASFYCNGKDWKKELPPEEQQKFLAFMWEESGWEWSYEREAGGRHVRCGFEDNCATVRASAGCP